MGSSTSTKKTTQAVIDKPDNKQKDSVEVEQKVTNEAKGKESVEEDKKVVVKEEKEEKADIAEESNMEDEPEEGEAENTQKEQPSEAVTVVNEKVKTEPA